MATSNKKGAAPAALQGPGADEERKPLPVPPGGWPRDEFTGQAGSFVRDPYTGIRRRADAPVAEPAPAAGADQPSE